MELIIGTKAWSSWSMRPWLVLKRARAPFEERLIPLSRNGATPEEIGRWSPSSRVPALRLDARTTIWDSLAISEYVADRWPEAALWPADPVRRALARAAAAEMHSGFASLRNDCPMELKLRTTAVLSAATAADVRRIVELWRGLLDASRGEGAYLFGGWTIADAFYTPVATRFRSYGVDLAAYGDDGRAQAYADALLATPEFLDWEGGA